MKKTLEIYKCKLVKDNSIEYIGSITNSNDVVNAAKKIGFADYSEEFFGMFTLNSKGDIIGYHEISHGDLTSSITHPREIFKRALLNNASAIIIIHNHPSGSVNPSDTDIRTTERLVNAGELIGIPVLDHILIGAGGDNHSMKANNEM